MKPTLPTSVSLDKTLIDQGFVKGYGKAGAEEAEAGEFRATGQGVL